MEWRVKWYESFADQLVERIALGDLTSVRTGGPARFLARPRNEEEAARLLSALAVEGVNHRILGGGYNLLVADAPIDDVVVQPSALTSFSVSGREVTVGAGLPLTALIARTCSLGLAGPHRLAGIPGQVGGAVAMNAGGRYGEIGPLVRRVHMLAPGGGAIEAQAEDLAFGYREARIPPGALITRVVLDLEAVDDPRALQAESRRILREKNEAQPTGARSFGCMFKNPEGKTAGVLIDEAGLKGCRRGGARISPLHGNFVENLGDATTSDILWLLEKAEEAVWRRAGIRLEREVRVWA